MIKVIFPPGCYGTFLSKCLYKFTDLNQSNTNDFVFDQFGSSHDFRNEQSSKKIIAFGHEETLKVNKTDKVIVILPCPEHKLDYFDNQFFKQQKKHLCNYIYSLGNSNEIQQKLSQNWNYHKKFGDDTPLWILREWCSFWIQDCLDHGYDPLRYEKFDGAIKINTQNIFENLENVILLLANKLELKVLADSNSIKIVHKNFVESQILHGIQKKCMTWVNDILQNNKSDSPCLTIFDESYVQYLLREKGFEIQCDGLNSFPDDATQMRNLIYHV